MGSRARFGIIVEKSFFDEATFSLRPKVLVKDKGSNPSHCTNKI